ncbi:bacteriocin immunity protein [Streptococcus ovis]|uniref:bacteriocin immunity protein n=1 Tax=Streptococcus ovis TaxID=82806 RepID=UPI00036269A0|nr:bacteriocin immunity protein [Streptococcus ovis]
MKKDQDIVELLYNALLDKEVAKDEELYQICLAAKADLEKNEPENLVFTKLSHSLSWYLMANKYTAPKTITDLAGAVQKTAQRYRSDIALSQILGGLFGGGPS